MNKASSGLAILVGFALLLGGFYLLYGYVTHTFAGLPSQLKPLVAICSIVALLCAAIVADGLKANAQREFRARVVEETGPVRTPACVLLRAPAAQASCRSACDQCRAY